MYHVLVVLYCRVPAKWPFLYVIIESNIRHILRNNVQATQQTLFSVCLDVQYSTVLYGTVVVYTVQYSTVYSRTEQNRIVQYSTLQYMSYAGQNSAIGHTEHNRTEQNRLQCTVPWRLLLFCLNSLEERLLSASTFAPRHRRDDLTFCCCTRR